MEKKYQIRKFSSIKPGMKFKYYGEWFECETVIFDNYGIEICTKSGATFFEPYNGKEYHKRITVII